jgi:predicted cation transporter
MMIGLLVIAVAVTLLPFLVRRVGDNLEVFFLLAGIAAVTTASQWSAAILLEALREPLKIAGAVLLASLLFHFFQEPLERGVVKLRTLVGPRILVAALIALVGVLSSFLTAIIAALVMVEAVSRLKLDRRTETPVVVLACFSIGLGAALTPFGGPLSAVVFSKLIGEPYHADTWFFLRNLWMYVVPGIAMMSAASLFFTKEPSSAEAPPPREERETLVSPFIRALKVYVFVGGLILFGAGFAPAISRYVGALSAPALFWVNITSAVLDNAALAAAEIAPSMPMHQIVAALMGLLIAGGMLVPGNIPNIISAGRLKIGSREWARVGVPVGMGMMIVMFGVLVLGG